MKLISEEMQEKLPEGTKIELITGSRSNSERDRITAAEITFSNNYKLRIAITASYSNSGLEFEELPIKL